ncbi:Rhodanese-like domain-containing protein [Microdochium trichocladiopsis]|uniref:Sulfurtransferase n=1 Tax=Microdochium trichocladiopsis TaxID=1682393 RepID=A0A9P8Y9B9_9PEZI|nr:Rhodanese-like domain-containing protein [Microdochium trichocladiopsis]KAH7031065.1 Rhodanese-like domain-containing protein [Microdochium trichocladiopsis]
MAARPGGGGGGGGGQGGLGTPPCGRRHESSSAGSGDTKIWSFEEVRDLTSSSSSSPTKITIIDVREPHELSSTGRIPGAINVPVKSAPDSWHVPEDEFEHAHGFPRPAKGAEVLFYCKAGVRSRAAAGLARDAGFTAVGEYPGSWDEWVAKGGKVQR